MEAKILYQEAYVNRLYLNIDFEYNDIKYAAKCSYFNGYGFEDIEVLEYDTDIEILDSDPIFDIAQDLLEDMDMQKYLTF